MNTVFLIVLAAVFYASDMFKTRVLIRIGAIYFLCSVLLSLWYLSSLDSNPIKSPLAHRLAIIVPYRDRSYELSVFLPHMARFLQSQLIDYLFVIVNQVDTHRFNRAALINIGFVESRSLVDYIVIHDIDLLPLNQRELSYQYPENGPVHVASPEYHPLYHYPTYAGGILLMTCDDFARVNGMSPLYWGWGREDDNFYVRMKRAGMKIYRPRGLSTNQTNTFRHIHEKDEHKRDYARYGNQKEEGRKINPDMGFNTTKYLLVRKEWKRTNEGIEYWMIDVSIECDYTRTPWCDHPTTT